MNKQFRYSFLSFAMLLALTLSAVQPIAAYADSGTPPVSPSPSANSSAPSRVKHLNDLSNIPAGTKVAVLNAMGNKVPLGSQAAADIIDASDPIWCPSGDLPDNANCTAGYTTVALLISHLGTKSGAGIVYFANTSTYATNDATFNQNNAHLTNLTDLTIQGGWNGSTSSPVISGVTTFSVPVTITNWNYDVTLNDIVISGVTSGNNGLTVKTKGNITLHNVKSNNNSGGVGGAKLDNTSGSGTSITVASDTNGESEFSNNDSNGLTAYSNGGITLLDVIADGNTNNGALLDNTSSTTNSTVTVDNSTGGEFNSNGLAGLKVYSNGDISLTDVIADSNDDSGAHLDNTGSSTNSTVTVDNTSGEFNSNGGAGIRVYSNGDISLTDVMADGNTDSGAHLDNTGSSTAGTVTVDNSAGGEFNSNGDAGIRVYSNGDISLTDVIADDNTNNGAHLDNTSSSTAGTVTVDNSTGGEFNSNGLNGLKVNSNGDVILTSITADGNYKDGAYIDNCGSDGDTCENDANVSIDNSLGGDFNGNGLGIEYDDVNGNGLEVYSGGDVSLTNVIADDNEMNGAQLGGSCSLFDPCDNAPIIGNVTVTGGDFSDNAGFDSQVICLFLFASCGGGLLISSAGAVNLTNVTANDNAQDLEEAEIGAGAAIFNLYGDSPVTINGTNTFNENGIIGLFVWSNSDVNASGVTADSNGEIGAYLANEFADPPNVNISDSHFDNNGTGLVLETAGNATVTCSTANNNETGVGGSVNGTFTMNGFTLDGNLFPSDVSGTVVNNPTNCNSKKTPGSGSGLPFNVIQVPDGDTQSNALDCANFIGTELVLPNGDLVLLPCPIGTDAKLDHVGSDKLPGALDSKFTFVSGFDVQVTPSLDGTAIVSFKIPSGKEGSKFEILHWDGTKWVSLGGSNGVPIAGYFGVGTDLGGDYVLVTE